MSLTITVRLPADLAAWREETSRVSGVAQGRIIRDQLERARARSAGQPFMRLAGKAKGPRELSSRKGFSRK